VLKVIGKRTSCIRLEERAPTVKPPYSDVEYITIYFILRSTPLINHFLVQYYDILAFSDIVKVSNNN